MGMYDIVLKIYLYIVEIPIIKYYIYNKRNKIRWRRV